MRVVVCEPGKRAYVKEIGNDLKSMQEAVEGCIEAYYPFDRNICIVCNDEGKMNGSRPSRGIFAENGELMDIVCGTFFVCDCGGDRFDSISPDDEKYIMESLGAPEAFYRNGYQGEIQVVKLEEEVI